uniref:Uncharacterized protein n=1 Tax=Arundo donax TaxID=35708 RepID=A0A0A8XZS6_ARUDO
MKQIHSSKILLEHLVKSQIKLPHVQL